MKFTPEQLTIADFWRIYITPALGKKAATLFRKASLRQDNWLADEIIRPRLFRQNALDGSATYYPVEQTIYSIGKSPYFAKLITNDPDRLLTDGGDPFIGLTYFANELRTASGDGIEEDGFEQPIDLAPKDRVVLGEHYIYTYEFDNLSLDFLATQLSWVTYKRGPLDCPIGDFFRACSGFADFRGITVNYSGHKSLHIHVVFATALAKAKLGLDNYSVSEIRHGLVKHWERLHEILLRHIDAKGFHADTHLRFPESYRRLPNGTRKAGEKHLLGIPESTLIHQVTLWERSRDRAAKDELPIFFTADGFKEDYVTKNAASRRHTSLKVGPGLTAKEIAHCQVMLRERYSDWPRFDHLSYEGNKWIAKFRNSESDTTPSSIMREDYRTIQMVGRDADGVQPKRLPLTLGQMLRLWCSQLPGSNAARSGTSAHPLEERFQSSVVDGVTAKAEMDNFFAAAIPINPLLMLVGPEGVGKTSTIMARHNLIVDDLVRRGESALAMYAFADYRAAIEKCEAFNQIQSQNGYKGVVLYSFSRLYAQACEHENVAPITIEDAARWRYNSRLEAIENIQPTIIERFKRAHASLWASIGKMKPVFFVVHQTMHSWRQNSTTRLMWSPSYWSQQCGKDAGRLDELRREMTLGLAVHDEIKAESIVDAYPEEIGQWVEGLVDSNRALWRAEKRDLTSLLQSFENYSDKHGFPKILGREVEVGFQEAQNMAAVPANYWDHAITKDTNEYGRRCAGQLAATEVDEEHRDIYAERHGRRWWVMDRGWWEGLADRVILLTTEQVPAAVVKASNANWAIFTLRAPLVPVDAVDVYDSRSVTGTNLATLCQQFRNDHPDEDYFIISNKVAMMTDTMTHAGARGSNELGDRHILQTMTFLTPGEYEYLQALNAWTGRFDMVGLRHIDEYNQTSGRNLGFRRQGRKHALLINRRLYQLLIDSGVVGHARYQMRSVLDKQQRYEATGRKAA